MEWSGLMCVLGSFGRDKGYQGRVVVQFYRVSYDGRLEVHWGESMEGVGGMEVLSTVGF